MLSSEVVLEIVSRQGSSSRPDSRLSPPAARRVGAGRGSRRVVSTVRMEFPPSGPSGPPSREAKVQYNPMVASKHRGRFGQGRRRSRSNEGDLSPRDHGPPAPAEFDTRRPRKANPTFPGIPPRFEESSQERAGPASRHYSPGSSPLIPRRRKRLWVVPRTPRPTSRRG